LLTLRAICLPAPALAPWVTGTHQQEDTMMIAVPAAIGLFLAYLWAVAHPVAAIAIGVAAVLVVIAVIRFCREIAPGLCVRSWSSPSAPRPRLCASCGWAV
jgi:hypothetical protein